MKNVILLDTQSDNDWSFKAALEKITGMKFEVKAYDTHNLQGKLSKFKRYFSYFSVPLILLKERKQIGAIVAWQQFYGLLYAFWCRLFNLEKHNKLIVMTFIYKKKKGIIGKIYDKFMRYIVTGGYVDYFICFSESECQKYAKYFAVSLDKWTSSKLQIEDVANKYKSYIEKGSFWLSAGRSSRDYKYLLDEAHNINEQIIVLCDCYSTDKCPSNVKFMSGVYGDEYFKLLAGCKGTIVPLINDDISAGQLVALQSMMMGKCCIITKTKTTEEYIQNYSTGILINNKPGELSTIINTWDSSKDKIGDRARKEFENTYSGNTLARTVGQLFIKEKT
ncbi:MAG: glycosyltransferase [Holdemanella porci]